jgi:type I restriction enzyme M protein
MIESGVYSYEAKRTLGDKWMITGELKSKVDRLWTTFWNNGISNPLSVIEQISYLLFIKRLDDLELAKEKKAQRLNRPIENLIFAPQDKNARWFYFKNLTDAEEMLRVVRDEAFPLIKNLDGEDKDCDRTCRSTHACQLGQTSIIFS